VSVYDLGFVLGLAIVAAVMLGAEVMMHRAR
jgi:hypothetical protein